jgi:hypothetical protein
MAMALILNIPSDEYNIVMICETINYTYNSSAKMHNYLFKIPTRLIRLIEACDGQ